MRHRRPRATGWEGVRELTSILESSGDGEAWVSDPKGRINGAEQRLLAEAAINSERVLRRRAVESSEASPPPRVVAGPVLIVVPPAGPARGRSTRWRLLALHALNELLRKRTETDVAFTLEYFWVSNPRGTIKRDQT